MVKLFKKIKHPDKIVYSFCGIRFTKKTPEKLLLQKLELLEKTIKADNNLILKFLTKGIEIHPSYGCERVVIDDYRDVMIYPEIYPDYYSEHIQRYLLVKNEIKENDCVLDIASGSGYGSKLIAAETKAKEIIGADISQYAVDFANHLNTYSNLRYIKADALQKKSFDKEQFDKIISFETLEHVPEADMRQMLQNFYSWLKKGGKLICSTPNELANPYIIDGKITNEYHHKHYTAAEIVNNLKIVNFERIKVFYQFDGYFLEKDEENHAKYMVFMAEK